ncbi:DnaJ-like protein [Legionella quinlivanii]|uniref:DnaJ-like protein n=2 Tax=Legionella quinlivanii TaxID=45073 RepID=A0A0W0XKX2_9GAMM|nr:DnaJ-like protein [Legionella quinlivanii]SEG05168.1 U-box domain-containing protein [Legionella quinlivanii DSM 21216]STY11494.1 chaperone protein DnaJ [Legionella quinlivanii]
MMEFLEDLLLFWRRFSSYFRYNDLLGRLAFRFFSYLLSYWAVSILMDHSGLPNIFSSLFKIALWELGFNFILSVPSLRIPANRQLNQLVERTLSHRAPNISPNGLQHVLASDLLFDSRALSENRRLTSELILRILTHIQYRREVDVQIFFLDAPPFIQSGNVQSAPARIITDQLHTVLEAQGILSEWIPRQYTCPITLMIIDGTPVYAKNSPERFNRNALLNWLDKDKSHPMTREDLSLDELKNDLVMEGKIKVFSHWILLKKEYLKHLTLAEALTCINQFTESLDRVFADKKESGIHRLAEQLIQRLQTSATEIECQKSLVVAKNEVSAFSTASTKILFFQALNLSTDAKPTQIEQAYRKLARRVHPDKNSRPEAKDAFFKLTEARDFLLKKRHAASETFNLESLEKIKQSIKY